MSRAIAGSLVSVCVGLHQASTSCCWMDSTIHSHAWRTTASQTCRIGRLWCQQSVYLPI